MRVWLNFPLIFVAALIATAGALPFFTLASSGQQTFYFAIDLASDTSGAAQVFYDVGRGMNESDSSTLGVKAGSDPKEYRFRIPAGNILKLRFDPLERPGNISIASPRIITAKGRTVRRLSLADFTPEQQVSVAAVGQEKLQLSIPPGANDPIMTVALQAPLVLRTGAMDILYATGGVWISAFVLSWVSGSLLNRLGPGRIARLTGALIRHPARCLAGVSALAITVQCHPVIFQGKSFVSPNNGSPMLYAAPPFVPGNTDFTVEDTKGSDVAALFHASLYYPGIEHDAVFHDHELPLWDRYSMCGLPLIGQGQSMFGSVFNLLPLLGNGSSLSWDLRYIVTRWFYAFGLGIAVWLLTRNLGASVVISAIGPFVGFFAFRLNHMAQFSVECAPWILVAWLLLRDADGPRSRLAALGVLFLANWEVMNSGTVKEAYMLIAALNAAGFLIVAFYTVGIRQRIAMIGAAAATGLVFLLVASPIWLTFFDAMRAGASHYERPVAWQAPTWQFPGFFDDIFYARVHPQEWHLLPAINAFLTAAAAWTIVRPGAGLTRRATACLWLVAFVAYAIAFGVMPGSWIIRVPILANVYHVHNTFSCVLLVVVTILAGIGVDGASKGLRSRWWHVYWACIAVLLAIPLFIYHQVIQKWSGSAFFNGYSLSLVLALITLYLGLSLFRRKANAGLLLVTISGAIVICGWRFCQFGPTAFDDYVVNPRGRVDFRAPSPAVEAINQHLASEPSRPAGLGLNMFCGFNQMLGFESIYGVDPIRNGYYDELAVAGGINKLLWGNPDTLKEMGGQPGQWHENELPVILPIQNLLNIRYYLATHQEPAATIAGLRYLGSYDLDLYESQNAWPRAFFVDRVMRYGEVKEVVSRARSGAAPFAAVQNTDIGLLPDGFKIGGQFEHAQVRPASHYRLTNNTTSFVINATGPGIAVLTENYSPFDFRAYLNGERVPYLRVNHAFKGIVVPRAGTYEVRFEYWPRRLNLALSLFAAGLMIAAAAVIVTLKRA